MSLLNEVMKKLQGATKVSNTEVIWENQHGAEFAFTLLPREPVIGQFPNDSTVAVSMGNMAFCRIIQQDGGDIKVFDAGSNYQMMEWRAFYDTLQKVDGSGFIH